MPELIKPSHKPIKSYDDSLADLRKQKVDIKPYDLDFVESAEEPLMYRVEKMKILSPDGKSAGKVDSSHEFNSSDRFGVWVNEWNEEFNVAA